MQPIIPFDKMPPAAVSRNAGYRYPWDTLKPGDCFEFSPLVKASSARVMCANNGVQYGKRYRCFRGADGKLYAQRVDGMLVELPAAKIVDAPVLTAGNMPAEHETFGVYGKNCADNIKLQNTSHLPHYQGRPYPPGTVPKDKETPYDKPGETFGGRQAFADDDISDEATAARIRGDMDEI